MLRGLVKKSLTLNSLALEIVWRRLKAISRCSARGTFHFGKNRSFDVTSSNIFFLVSKLSCHRKSRRTSGGNEVGLAVCAAMATQQMTSTFCPRFSRLQSMLDRLNMLLNHFQQIIWLWFSTRAHKQNSPKSIPAEKLPHHPQFDQDSLWHLNQRLWFNAFAFFSLPWSHLGGLEFSVSVKPFLGFVEDLWAWNMENWDESNSGDR